MAIKTAYGWKDIDVVILGNIPIFITEITYEVNHEKKNGYGNGNSPNRRGRGRKTYDNVRMVLGMEECIQIELAIQNRFGKGFDPTDLKPFDIPIIYDNGDVALQDIIYDFEWTRWGRGAQEGDMEINQECPGICSKIDFNQPL
jgi:hypothetical protein